MHMYTYTYTHTHTHTHIHPFARGGWRPGRACHRNDQLRLPVLFLALGGTRAPLYCHCSPPVLQCVSVCCSVLQCVAVCCSVLQCDVVRCSVLQRIAVCCSVSFSSSCTCCCCMCVLSLCIFNRRFDTCVFMTTMYISGSCRVLQCVAVCCSMMQ